jgi:methionine aminopeptidase
MRPRPRPDPEGVGTSFTRTAMIRARDLTFAAVNRIADAIHPGMTEGHAHAIADEVLEAMGMDKLWHKNVIRFGAGTLKTFRGAFEPDCILKADDLFFVDLGVVWDGHEGDAGDTFVVGGDPDMHAIASAARELWTDVAQRWRDDRLGGHALYRYASDQAQARGYRLNWDVKGHRVSDFPHAIYKAGTLGDFEAAPSPWVWILEIQLAHPTRPIGAFFEDLLIGPAAPALT